MKESLSFEYRLPVMKYLCAIISNGELYSMLKKLFKISRTTNKPTKMSCFQVCLMNIASLWWNILVQSYLTKNYIPCCKNYAKYQGQQTNQQKWIVFEVWMWEGDSSRWSHHNVAKQLWISRVLYKICDNQNFAKLPYADYFLEHEAHNTEELFICIY